MSWYNLSFFFVEKMRARKGKKITQKNFHTSIFTIHLKKHKYCTKVSQKENTTTKFAKRKYKERERVREKEMFTYFQTSL